MRDTVKVGLGICALFFLFGLMEVGEGTIVSFIIIYLGFSLGVSFIVFDSSPGVKGPSSPLKDSTRWGVLFGLFGMYLASVWVRTGGEALVFTICLLIVCGAILLVLDKDFSDN